MNSTKSPFQGSPHILENTFRQTLLVEVTASVANLHSDDFCGNGQ